MADFTPPFAEDGERRLPTTTEQALGLSCDPQQLRELLNGIFNLHQGQIKTIADEAGVTPSGDGDKTLLNRAVLALIAAATGGGDTSAFVLFSQARARLPIFPEVLNTAGTIVVTAPSTGTVRVPAGTSFLHRGIFTVTTTQTDFSTDPSKTYHLRWNPTDGFVMRDLASGTYNPGTLAEANVAFDSTFDDMLVARVITNSSNVATITNLANKDRITISGETGLTRHAPFEDSATIANITAGQLVICNLARRPRAAMTAVSDFDVLAGGLSELNFGVRVRSRYDVLAFYANNHTDPFGATASVGYEVWL
jgi:hypothetical protein